MCDLIASSLGGQGDVMQVPKGYLQAWLEHVRSDMQSPASEADSESLLFLLKVRFDVLVYEFLYMLHSQPSSFASANKEQAL